MKLKLVRLKDSCSSSAKAASSSVPLGSGLIHRLLVRKSRNIMSISVCFSYKIMSNKTLFKDIKHLMISTFHTLFIFV